MKLKELIKNLEVIKFVNFNEKTLNLDIKNLCDNSNSKLKNSAFVCINGLNFDSHSIVSNLSKKGVVFFVCEKIVNTTLPYVIVKNSRQALSILADNFFGNPTKSLKIISIIGTNGKTSTSYFIQKMLKLNNVSCGVIGTSGVYINSKRFNETLTTPDPILLYKLLRKMAECNCKVVVMEISAHAIKLNKVDKLVSDVCIFTNFSQDHLDFFKTMQNYKETKFSYFNNYNVKKAIINVNDVTGQELFLKIRDKIKCLTYGLVTNADICAKNIKCYLNKTEFDLSFLGKNYSLQTKTSCEFNVLNILSGILALNELNIMFDITSTLKKLTNVKGRFNVYKLKNNRYIIIDYAHTPESLREVLLNTSSLSKNKIISLFGCPGNRDEEKREIMGEIAYKYSKKIYITSDNPKFENPLIICNEILRGAKEKGEIILDREKAIKKAIKNLKNNEILLILGKGIEKYQDINGIHFNYSDVKVVKKCIKTLKN